MNGALRVTLLAMTAALVVAATVLTVLSFRRNNSDDSTHDLTGMVLMLAAALPAAIYATLTP